MQNRIATMVALIAAIFGALLSLFTTINWFIDLVRLGIQPARLAFQFLASNDWIGYGLILFFALIYFLPRQGAWGELGLSPAPLLTSSLLPTRWRQFWLIPPPDKCWKSLS